MPTLLPRNLPNDAGVPPLSHLPGPIVALPFLASILFALPACGSNGRAQAVSSWPEQDASSNSDAPVQDQDAGTVVGPDLPTGSEPSGVPKELWPHPTRHTPFLVYFGPYDGPKAGQYELVSPMDTGNTPSLRTADLDGNGSLEILAGSPSGSMVVYTNFGTPSEPRWIQDLGVARNVWAGVQGFAVGDLDQDGRDDVASFYGNGSLLLFHADGTPAQPHWTAEAELFAKVTIPQGQYWGSPALGDVDGDGDLDLVIGLHEGAVLHVNQGTATEPSFPGDAVDLGLDLRYDLMPAIHDVDGDGDADLVFGTTSGGLTCYINDGTPAAPVWSLFGQPVRAVHLDGQVSPWFADLDGDGADEILTADDSGMPRLYYHIGTASTGLWSNTRWFPDTNVLGEARPALGDVDNDGDLDVLVGDPWGALHLVQNVGSATAPVYHQQPSPVLDNLGDGAQPAMADTNGDGILELVVGSSEGLHEFRRTAGSSPVWEPVSSSAIDALSLQGQCAPAFGDVDGNGSPDLVVLLPDAVRLFHHNAGAWVESPGAMNGVDPAVGGSPALLDLNADGRAELLLGTLSGWIRLYRQEGSTWVEDALTLQGVHVGNGNAPTGADLDGDGDTDLVVGEMFGTLQQFQNEGTAALPMFGAGAGFAGIEGGADTLPVGLADLDGDGRKDLITRGSMGNLRMHRWMKDGLPPVVSERADAFAGISHPEDIEPSAWPALCDFDQDGDADVVIASGNGALAYAENVGSAKTPSFAVVPGAIKGSGNGTWPSATCGDLDGDGRPELLVSFSLKDAIRLYVVSKTAPMKFTDVGELMPADPTRTGAIALADVDLDGDQDLVFSRFREGFGLWRNIGTLSEPDWMLEKDPWPGLRVGMNMSVALGDLDGDSPVEWVVGDWAGQLRYFDAVVKAP